MLLQDGRWEMALRDDGFATGAFLLDVENEIIC